MTISLWMWTLTLARIRGATKRRSWAHSAAAYMEKHDFGRSKNPFSRKRGRLSKAMGFVFAKNSLMISEIFIFDNFFKKLVVLLNHRAGTIPGAAKRRSRQRLNSSHITIRDAFAHWKCCKFPKPQSRDYTATGQVCSFRQIP